MRTLVIAAVTMVLGVVVAAPARAQASQAVDAQWAQQFLGSWNVELATPDGTMPLVLTVREDAGKVVVALGDGQGETPPITNVTRAGEALVASYDMDYQGMTIDATIRMERAGDVLDTDWSFAGGSYETSAHGTRR